MAKMSKEEWRRHEIERLRRETQSPQSFKGPTTPRQNPMDTTPKSLNSGRSYDPRYFVAPDEYQDGNLPQGGFALASGGTAIADALRLAKKVKRNKYAVGGAPTDLVAGTNPATAVPPVGAVSGTPVQAPTAGNVTSAYQRNPTQAYIDSLYQNVLGRQADTGGEQYWMNQLNSGELNQGQILQNFAGSNEFQNLYKTDPHKAVTALYQTALGRAPEEAGLHYWEDQAQHGLALPTMTENFLNSAEGQNVSAISQAYQDATGTVPTNEQLLQAQQALASGQDLNSVIDSVYNTPTATAYLANNLYQNYTGTQATPDQIKEFQAQLEQGVDPSEIASQIESSDAANAYQDTQFIKDEYQGLYGRAPKDEELKAALDQLNKGLSYDQLDKSLGESEESQLYQASNFEPYDVASNGKTPRPNQARTTYQQLKQFYDNLRTNGIPDALRPLVDAISKGEGGPNSINNGTVRGKIIGATNDASKVLGKPLDQHTVGEVMKLQQGTPATGRKIFASGKLQMIPSTLKSVVRSLGIDPNTLYDETSQVGLGLIAGLQKPALLKFLTGQSNNIDAAAKALAQVWASLPNPKTGRSLYGSGNKSSHSVAEIKNILQKAKGSVSFAPSGKGTGETPIGKEQPDGDQAAPSTGGVNPAPPPGWNMGRNTADESSTSNFLGNEGVPQEDGQNMSGFTDLSTGKVYDKPIDVGGPGGGQGASNDTGGSFDVADNGGYWDGAGWVSGWADQPSQGPELGYSTWGPWSEDYYRYEPDMLGLKRGGRVARGLEIAKRASGGNLVKDALRIADRKRQNDAIGSVEPMPDYMSRDDWTPERWAQARRNRIAKTPNSGPSATTPKSSPAPATPDRNMIPREDYERGNLTHGQYALARGGSAGRKGYAVGGTPTDLTAGTNPTTATPTTPQTTNAPAGTNPYHSYVDALYKNVLGRQADVPGEQYWENQLNTGATTTQDMLNNFAASQEYQNLYKADPTKAISGMYQAALDRAPEQAGLQYWTGQAQHGLTANQLASAFASAPEFQNRDAVFNSYLNYTGAPPTPEQYASSLNDIKSGKSLTDVASGIVSSPAGNTNLVKTAYREMLGREAEPEAINYWTNQLNKGTLNTTEFLNGLASSSEGANYANTKAVNNMYENMFGISPTAQDINNPYSTYNDYLSKLAAGTLNEESLYKTMQADPLAQNYQNKALLNDTAHKLLGRAATVEEQNNYLPRLATGELDANKMAAEIAARPDSQAYQKDNANVAPRNNIPEPSSTSYGYKGFKDYLKSALDAAGTDVYGRVQAIKNAIGMPLSLREQAGLDLLSKNEAGDYNTILGDIVKGPNAGPATGKVAKQIGYTGGLENMPLDQLYKLQGDIIRTPFGAKKNSSAAGKYQFVRNTLFGTEKSNFTNGELYKMGITPDMWGKITYSPALQDKLAVQRINDMRHLDVGNTNTWFKPGMTQEFQSMPETLRNKEGLKAVNNMGEGPATTVGGQPVKLKSTPATPGTPGTPDTFKPGDQSSVTAPNANLAMVLAGQGAGGNVGANSGAGAGTGITTGNQPGVTLGAAGNEALAASLAQQAAAQKATGTGVPNNSYDANLAYLAGTGAGNAGASPGVVTPGAISTASSGKGIDFNAGLQGSGIASSGSTGSNPANYTFTPATGTGFTGTGSPIGTANWYTAPIYTPPSYGGGGYYGGGSYGTGYGSGYGGGGYGGYAGVGAGSWGGNVGGSGLGMITVSRKRGGAVTDALQLADHYANGGNVWNKPRPKSLGKPKHLSSKQKASAKAAAKAAGRPYPNLVDNMRAAQKSHGGPLSKAMNLTRRLLDE